MSEVETPKRVRRTQEQIKKDNEAEAQREINAHKAAPSIVDSAEFQPIVYGSKMTYMHHLYKLAVTMFKKNIAQDEQAPEYIDVEHAHFFHSITSDGKPQTQCNSVGGHFHKIEIKQGPAGTAPKVVCASGPMKYARKKNKYNQWERIIVPANDVDDHTHDILYIKSDKIEPKGASTEAAKVIGYFENKLAVPSGEIGGGKIEA